MTTPPDPGAPQRAWGLLDIGPHADAHWGALRAVVVLGASGTALLASGHAAWILFAVFGAFASVYGRQAAYGPRLRMQLSAAAVLVGSVVVGTAVATAAPGGWLAVAVAAGVGALAQALSRWLGWKPPGALFPVFAVGACSSHAQSATTVAVALGLSAGTAALALVLGQLGRAFPAGRRPKSARSPRTPLRVAFAPTSARLDVVLAGLVPLVAGGLALALGGPHPSWAMVASVAPLGAPSSRDRVLRGLQRALGTAAGVVVTVALLSLDPAPAVTFVLALLFQAWAELLVLRHYALAVVGITPLALLMQHLAAPAPVLATGLDRLAETVLGVGVALVGLWVVRLVVDRASRAIFDSPDPAGRGTIS